MKDNLHKELEEKLSRAHAYVLITCDQGKKAGTLDIEMSYGGDDPALASYLLSDAQSVIEEEEETIE